MTSLTRGWVLESRPRAGGPHGDEVRLREVPLGGVPLDGGEETAGDAVLVRNLAFSLEPYLLGRISGKASYADPFPLGEVLRGPAVGVVEQSEVSWLPVGAYVLHDYGWRERARVRAEECTLLPAGLDPLLSLGIAGLTGMTAWVGLRKIARVAAGETVFVSSAAGAVGSAVVQIARAAGCTVIGSAGSPAKCDAVLGLGAHAVFDYRAGPARDGLRGALERAGASGLDVYFDNVGGEQLEAAIREMNVHGRVALCGMTSTYDLISPQAGPSNLLRLVWNRVRMEGFLLRDHTEARSEFLAEMSELIARGAVRSFDTVLPGGIGEAWRGFLRMREGAFTGKAVAVLDELPA